MFSSTTFRGFAAALCLVGTAACGSSSPGGSSSGSAANPSSPSTPALDLAGSWSGTLASPQGDGSPDPNPNRVTWTASQSGATLTGPVIVLVTEGQERREFRGTLSGTLAGTELTLRLEMPPGVFSEAPACSLSGAGTATATASSISSALTITFAPVCLGVVTEKATETDLLTLAKQ